MHYEYIFHVNSMHLPCLVNIRLFNTVEFAYFEVIPINKGLRIIRISNYQNT